MLKGMVVPGANAYRRMRILIGGRRTQFSGPGPRFRDYI